MSGSAVSGALASLAGVWTPILPTGWQIVDGRPYDPKRKLLAVGWSGMDEPAVTADRGVSDYGLSQTEEMVQVFSLAQVWSGSEKSAAARAEVFEVFDLCEAALVADPTLADSCMLARISEFQYVPAYMAEGVLAQVQFVTEIQALQ